MDHEDSMPCGECCVCGELVDHQDAGFCGGCKGAFHWTRCGEWGPSEHECRNCKGNRLVQDMPEDDPCRKCILSDPDARDEFERCDDQPCEKKRAYQRGLKLAESEES